MMKIRGKRKPDYFENNLLSKYNVNTKKLEFIKSGCDILYFYKSREDINKKIKSNLKKNIKRNIAFRFWCESKLQSK